MRFLWELGMNFYGIKINFFIIIIIIIITNRKEVELNLDSWF